MEEEWRDIKGYEGKYQVSNLGRVKSLRSRYGNYREKILSNIPNTRGYLQVVLYKNGNKKFYTVHKLVAEAFIDNSNNYPQVNHKDEDKSNNKVDNLEWCTQSYNNNYGTRTQRQAEKIKGSKHPKARKVLCITTRKTFTTTKEAAEYYSINRPSISACCKGKRKSAGKHPITGEKLVWKYIDNK